MHEERKPTRLGQAILATLAALDPPDGRSRNEAARRARVEPTWVSKVIYGKVAVGFNRLRRLAAANGVTEPQWQTWINAKIEDQREAAELGQRLAGATLSPGAPEVARLAPPATFPTPARGAAPGSPRGEAADVAHAPDALRAGELAAEIDRGAGPRPVVRPLHPAPQYVTREELDERLARLREEIVQRVLDARADFPYKRAA